MEYPKMRRKDRELSEENAWEILKKAEYGVLSMRSAATGVYGVPLSYAVDGKALYVHCAGKGHKIDALQNDAQVCFTAVASSQPVFDKDFTTYFESAIAFGQASFVEDAQEKTEALRLICQKYLPDFMEHFNKAIENSFKVTTVIKVDISHVTAKAKAPTGQPGAE